MNIFVIIKKFKQILYIKHQSLLSNNKRWIFSSWNNILNLLLLKVSKTIHLFWIYLGIFLKIYWNIETHRILEQLILIEFDKLLVKIITSKINKLLKYLYIFPNLCNLIYIRKQKVTNSLLSQKLQIFYTSGKMT